MTYQEFIVKYMEMKKRLYGKVRVDQVYHINLSYYRIDLFNKMKNQFDLWNAGLMSLVLSRNGSKKTGVR